MKIVTDSQNREWTLQLTLSMWERLVARGLVPDGLDEMMQWWTRFAMSPSLQCKVLWVLLAEQARDKKIMSEGAFINALTPEDLGLLRDPLLEEFRDFFVATGMKMMARLAGFIETEVPTIIERRIEALRDLPTSAAVLSELTRGASVSPDS